MSDLAIDLYNKALDIETAMADCNLSAFPTLRRWDPEDIQRFTAALAALQRVASEIKQITRQVTA